MFDIPQLVSSDIGLYIHHTPCGIVGEIILQRETALNAHDIGMNESILMALDFYATLDKLHCVLLTSTHSQAFCAGGDVRALREFALTGQSAKIYQFFRSEYTVDYYLAHYPVPVISIVNGIAFGGGAGFAIHPRYTVVTENAVFAMPEAAIGLYPDAGSSYFLQNLPHNAGVFLALTGCRVNAKDALYLGLAQSFIPHQDLRERLKHMRETGDETSLLQAAPIFTYKLGAPDLDFISIEKITAQPNFRAAIEAISYSSWSETLSSVCQNSLELAWGILAKNSGHDLATCLARELEISTIIAQGPDFAEGVRAMLVDKDKIPKFGNNLSSLAIAQLMNIPIDPHKIKFS